MRNYKLAKTAVALILGASIVTSAVVPTDVSAASKYKIKSGKLVVAKTGKTATGYVTYKKVLYKAGKKFTGLKSKIYYKSGKKATGTYKGAYYISGAKKVTTGTYNKAYYVKGVKKVTTGLYASKYYKEGKIGTGTYKATYYVNGVKKATTGYYNGAYYVKGAKKVTTGLYKEQYYVKGKVSKGLAVYKKQLYKDGNINVGLIVFKDELYDGATKNKGIKAYEDETGLELFYDDEKLANDTFFIDEKEEAFENGVKVGAKVSSIEGINGTTIEVKFNKAVDKKDAESELIKEAIKVENASVATTSLSEDGRTLTITFKAPLNLKEATVEIPAIKTKADTTVSTPKYIKLVNYSDTVAPTIISAAAAIAKVTDTVTNKVTVKFSEPVQSSAIAYVNDANVSVSQGDNKNELILTLGTGVKVGDLLTIKLTNVKDLTGNIISPNPADISTTVLAADSTAPVVTSIETKSITDELSITLNFDKKVIASTVDENKSYLSASGINVGSLQIPSVSADGKSVTFKVNLNELAKTAFAKEGKFTVDLYTQEALVTDEAGNKSAASNQSITFTKDTVAPLLTTSEFKDNKLVLNFNEAVKVVDAKKAVEVIAYNAQTGFEKTLTSKELNAESLSKDGKTISIDLGVTAEESEKAYKVSFVKGALTDDSGNEVAAYNETIIVKKAEVVAIKDTVAPSIDLTGNAVEPTLIGDNYIMKFEIKDLKGLNKDESESGLDFSSILNLGNYTIAGKALPSGTKISTNAEDANTFGKANALEVTITIPKASIQTNLDGPLIVTGIKDRNGNTVSTLVASKSLLLKEGVAPVLKSGQIVDNVIVLNFSEKVIKLITTDLVVSLNNKVLTMNTETNITEGLGVGKGSYYLNLDKFVEDKAATELIVGGFFDSSNVELKLPVSPAAGDTIKVGAALYTYVDVVGEKAAGYYNDGVALVLPKSGSVGDKVTVTTVSPATEKIYTYRAEKAAEKAYKFIKLDGVEVKLSKGTIGESPEIQSIKVTTIDTPTSIADDNGNILVGKTVINIK